MKFLGYSNISHGRTVINPAHQFVCLFVGFVVVVVGFFFGGGLVEMTTGLATACLTLPEWQAVKVNFFAP